MDGRERRTPNFRPWVILVLACALIVLAIIAGKQISIGETATRAHQLLRIDTALGATLEPLDPQTAKSLGYGGGRLGMVVTSTASGGPADRAGLRVGDVIEEINGRPSSIAEVAATLGTPSISMVVNRRGNRAKIRLQPALPRSEAGSK